MLFAANVARKPFVTADAWTAAPVAVVADAVVVDAVLQAADGVCCHGLSLPALPLRSPFLSQSTMTTPAEYDFFWIVAVSGNR